MRSQLGGGGQTAGIHAAREGRVAGRRLPEQIHAVDKDRRRPEPKAGIARRQRTEVYIHECGLAPNHGQGVLETGTHFRGIGAPIKEEKRDLGCWLRHGGMRRTSGCRGKRDGE